MLIEPGNLHKRSKRGDAIGVREVVLLKVQVPLHVSLGDYYSAVGNSAAGHFFPCYAVDTSEALLVEVILE